MNISGLKLYHYPVTRSARVKWMLHEVVETFDVEYVDLYDGAQYRSDFVSINPNHGVPVLEVTWDTGVRQRLIESASIVGFLADAFPEKGLAPANYASPERADYLQMLHFGSTWMDMMLWQIRIHEHVLPAAECDAATIKRYRAKFTNEVEPQLAARLEHKPFICGDAFIAADCVVGHSVFWARGYDLCQGDVFKRYLGLLAERPAFQSAFSDAKQFSAAVPAEKRLVTQFTG